MNTFETLAPLEPLIDKCVHCGFCLPACPSYLLLGQEMDSPRGRIYMMKAGVEDRLDVSAPVVQHFDTCLGCMACETACPSGVRYAPLIEQTRAAIEAHHERSLGDRLFRGMLFRILPYHGRLRVLSVPLGLVNLLRRIPGVFSWLPLRIRNLIALAPSVTPGAAWRDVAERTPATGATRLRVGLVTGCVQRAFFGEVNEATIRTLAAEGCEVVAPRSQGCCGALGLHSGQDEDARAFAKKLIAVFERENVDQVVVNAAGCGSSMKQYGELLAHDPEWAERARVFSAKVRDVTETLSGLEARAPRKPLAIRVAYHDACHLAHAQGIRREPRTLLESIPGLTIVPLADPDLCCGSAGIFNLVQPEMAAELGRRKMVSVSGAKADVVATSNPGCILQIGAAARAAGQRAQIYHIVQLLDWSIAGGSEKLGIPNS